MPNEKMLFARHLDEEDDLKTWGRDAPLEQSDENRDKLTKIVDAIAEKVDHTNKDAVLFITSPRLRARQTAHLTADGIAAKSQRKIKFRFSEDENLKATEQGEILLPDDYKPGDFFEGLDLADKIFKKEVFGDGTANAKTDLHYRFGDPVIRSNGTYKYPELAKYFKESGETYAETLVRIFSSIVEISQKADKLEKSTEVVVVAHGQTYHLLRGLAMLGEQIRKGDTTLSKGEMVGKLWEIYNATSADQKVTGICLPLDYSLLNDAGLVTKLKDEIEFLKEKKEIPDSLRALGKDIADLPIAKNILSFLVYGSVLEKTDKPNDLDIIVVAKNVDSSLRPLFELLSKRYSKVDFHIYSQAEISGDLPFYTREFVLEYLSKGKCLYGEHIFKSQWEKVTKEQYKDSLLIRSVEYIQMVRKRYLSSDPESEATKVFIQKYFLRLAKCLLLLEGHENHDTVNKLDQRTILEKLHTLGVIERIPELDEKSSATDYFDQFDVLRDALIESRKEIGQ